MEEIWKTIPDTDGRYSVSNLGNVKRNEHYTNVRPKNNRVLYKERLLKFSTDSSGYFVVKLLIENNKSVSKKVHRLVAETFLSNPNNLNVVNHKDENKQNNCVDNLEWCSDRYNANYGTRNNRISKALSIKVAQYTLDRKLVKVWSSMSQAALHFGAKTTTYIRRVCKSEFGRKTYKGYMWKYVEQKIIGAPKDCIENVDKSHLAELIKQRFTIDELYIIINRMKHESELQKQKDDAALEREKIKARTALKNKTSGEK